jgi:hypothetical protein
VTIEAIRAAIQSAAAKMDRDRDLLVLILTSHGSPAGIAVQAGRRVEILSPSALAGLLDGAGARHRIVIISACYSGVFLCPLANDDTLVITAADSEHSSFGCQDKVKWTYFGDAFFNTALRRDGGGQFENTDPSSEPKPKIDLSAAISPDRRRIKPFRSRVTTIW